MTTNESSKWADWRDEIEDGTVFGAERRSDSTDRHPEIEEVEPYISWPISSTQQLVRTENGQPPEGQAQDSEGNADLYSIETAGTKPRWKRLRGLDEVENLYDLGFWDNLIDILPT